MTTQIKKNRYVCYFEEIAQAIKDKGFIVYQAENGDYGFFTDETGERTVTIQVNPTVQFYGNYFSDGHGTGWVIGFDFISTKFLKEDLKKLLYAHSPWTFKRYTTVKDYLDRYQQSSRYKVF